MLLLLLLLLLRDPNPGEWEWAFGSAVTMDRCMLKGRFCSFIPCLL